MDQIDVKRCEVYIKEEVRDDTESDLPATNTEEEERQQIFYDGLTHVKQEEEVLVPDDGVKKKVKEMTLKGGGGEENVDSVQAQLLQKNPSATSVPSIALLILPKNFVLSSKAGQSLVAQAIKQPEANPGTGKHFGTMQPSSPVRSPLTASRTVKHNRPLDNLSKSKVIKKISDKEFEQKRRYLKEKHRLKRQILKQQLRSAELLTRQVELQERYALEQESLLKKIHLTNMALYK